MKRPALLLLFSLALTSLLVACDDNKVEVQALPSAFFTTQVQDVLTGFVTSYTNLSRDSKGAPAGQTLLLSYLWTFEGKGTSASADPGDRIWTYRDLGLTAGVAGVATRTVELSVTEDNDPGRQSSFTETLIFEIAESAESTAEPVRSVYLIRGNWVDAKVALKSGHARLIYSSTHPD